MAWIAEDRRVALSPEKVSPGSLAPERAAGQPLLTEALKSHLRETYFPRFPTRRAVLLPALHLMQHTYNWIPPRALSELAEFLEISPGEALDTATFYEEYWLKPKGKYLLQICRSLTCELCESSALINHISRRYNVEPGETTADGRFTLVEMECIGSCGTAPAALVNEVLLENLTVEKLDAALDALPSDPHDYHDPSITWERLHGSSS